MNELSACTIKESSCTSALSRSSKLQEFYEWNHGWSVLIRTCHSVIYQY